MILSDPLPPNAIAVRVGCRLVYATSQPAAALLLIRPHPDVAILEESLSCDTGSPAEHFIDHHGNRMLRTILRPGLNEFVHDAILIVPGEADDPPPCTPMDASESLPWEVLRYTFPSRYCESDKLGQFAQQTFGGIPPGVRLAQAICDWTHRHIEYRYGSGNPHLSAADVIGRGYGVCRDFAHVMVALCRALDMPARYVAGHMPYRGVAEHDIGIDFHAWCEVFAGGRWHTFDPRHNKSLPGRVKLAHGMDAVDAAFATFYGHASAATFQVWSYQVDPALARAGDPIAIIKGGNGSAEEVAGACFDAFRVRPPLPHSLHPPSLQASSPARLHG
ncbi:transglutaminase-like domain-containing protein [Noviherbaspirillum sp.]|uniref:transglutaminase-like domain-containing protein n=1 Tax=Noviherbaspirillum sp. TaxID=1926288 RepID=UPI002FE1E2D8